jgi:hypothetical protein
MAALDDRPRSGKEPTINAEAKAFLVSLACRKAKELGYPHELWTTRLLARHARERGPAEGHPCLAKLVQERSNLARPTASRRFVFTRSPGFFGMSEGAATMQSWPSFPINRWSPYPVGPAS